MKILNHVLSDSQCSSKSTSTSPSISITTKQTTKHNHHIHTQSSSSKQTISTNSHLSNVCTGTENKYIMSQNGCEYFSVCMKGFSSPIGTVKCPNNFWFNLSQQTCVKTRPVILN